MDKPRRLILELTLMFLLNLVLFYVFGVLAPAIRSAGGL